MRSTGSLRSRTDPSAHSALGGLQAFLLVAFLLHFEAAVLPFFEFWSHFSVSLFLLVAVDLTQRSFDPLAKQRGVSFEVERGREIVTTTTVDKRCEKTRLITQLNSGSEEKAN